MIGFIPQYMIVPLSEMAREWFLEEICSRNLVVLPVLVTQAQAIIEPCPSALKRIMSSIVD